MLFFAGLVAVLSGVIGVSSGAGSGGLPGDEWGSGRGSDPDGLELEILLNRTRVALGDPVAIKIKSTNHRDGVVRLLEVATVGRRTLPTTAAPRAQPAYRRAKKGEPSSGR